MGEVPDRSVAVEDLDEEDVDGGDGVEEAGTPFMADISAEGEDGGSIEKLGGVLLEAVKDANHPVMHSGGLLYGVWFNHHRDRRFFFMQPIQRM
jgi:hypothetical protein